jgi:hypothetical protein
MHIRGVLGAAWSAKLQLLTLPTDKNSVQLLLAAPTD